MKPQGSRADNHAQAAEWTRTLARFMASFLADKLRHAVCKERKPTGKLRSEALLLCTGLFDLFPPFFLQHLDILHGSKPGDEYLGANFKRATTKDAPDGAINIQGDNGHHDLMK